MWVVVLQLATFRETRAAALKKFAELKASNEQLTSDLNLANQRLRTARLTCQVGENPVQNIDHCHIKFIFLRLRPPPKKKKKKKKKKSKEVMKE